MINEHLEMDDLMQLTSSYRNTGTVNEVEPEILEHIRICSECNAQAAAFMILERHLMNVAKKKQSGVKSKRDKRKQQQ